MHLCLPLPPCSAARRPNWFHLATSILLSDRPGSLFALVKIDYWRKLQIKRRTKEKEKKLLVAQTGTISSSSLMTQAGAVFAMIKFDVIGELQIKEKWKKVKFFPSNLIPFPFILLYV